MEENEKEETRKDPYAKNLVDKLKEANSIRKESGLKNAERIIGDQQKILEMSQISIWLDDYDDIFSDFDPRQYSSRSLSNDFLNEAKKAGRDKPSDKLELRILIAENIRDARIEGIIKKRLRDHFTKHAKILKKEIKKTRMNSIVFGFMGILTIFIASIIPDNNFFERFIFVMLEPTGWFITWFALDKVFYSEKSKKEESKFYDKMSKVEIIFSSY